MSGKKLNTEAITSELAGSAFFPIKPVNNRQTDVPSNRPQQPRTWSDRPEASRRGGKASSETR